MQRPENSAISTIVPLLFLQNLLLKKISSLRNLSFWLKKRAGQLYYYIDIEYFPMAPQILSRQRRTKLFGKQLILLKTVLHLCSDKMLAKILDSILIMIESKWSIGKYFFRLFLYSYQKDTNCPNESMWIIMDLSTQDCNVKKNQIRNLEIILSFFLNIFSSCFKYLFTLQNYILKFSYPSCIILIHFNFVFIFAIKTFIKSLITKQSKREQVKRTKLKVSFEIPSKKNWLNLLLLRCLVNNWNLIF